MRRPVQIFNYQILNQTDDSVDIFIDGDIVDASTQSMLEAWFGDTTSVSFKSFRNQLNKVDVKTYNIIINCLGGHVGDAMAMHDWMRSMQDKGKIINTKGIGIVASSGTLILLAGKNPEMSENSWFMMHTVSGGIFGTVDQVENYAVTMRKFNDQIRDLYALRSGMRKEEVSKLMDKETWLSAKEAKEKGFISNVSGETSFTNRISKELWEDLAYTNTTVLNSYNNYVKEPQTEDNMKQWLLNLKTEIMNAVKGVAAPAATAEGHEAFINALAEAIGKPFDTAATAVEAAVNDAITTSVKPVDITAAVNAAVTAAIKPLQDQIVVLEQDIANKVGKKSDAPEGNGVVPIGNFN